MNANETEQEVAVLRQSVGALRQRVDRLWAAIQHINASLDPDTVLREILKSARALTGARCGVIVSVDDAGVAHDLTSSGFADDERQRLFEWPDGPRMFEYVRDLPGPLRIPDAAAYAQSLGLMPWLPAMALVGTPMRHRDARVGYFFLADKASGGAFTDDDEETLVLLASQAAIALANARSHRAEQQARSNLEVLVETSPVGVLVFDAHTGVPTLANREANRVMAVLRTAGQSAREMLEAATCRLSDGREIALDQLAVAEALRHGGPVRDEEVQVSVPDGRSVSMLVNSTPIHAEDGDIESVVVTMQDLAPIEEIDRMRAEFLGTVSHELRAPLAAIKGSAATALGTSRDLDPAETRQFFAIVDEQADHMDRLISDLLDVGRIDTGTLAVALESTDVAILVDRARSTFISGGARHDLEIDLPRDLPRVMADPRRIVQVLGNLLANAAKHSAETSPLRISAERDGAYVAISVGDDGAGMTPDELARLFRKHVGDGAGGLRRTGLGLVICKGLVEANGGRIRAESGGRGQGTRVTFTVPVADMAPASGAGQSTRQVTREDVAEPILVVDDDPQMLRHLRDMLAEAGYAPIVTGVPAELDRIIEAERPRLVLLDLMLPGTDGIELMRTVPALRELPVIFISGYGRDETVAKALDSGAFDYIVKPFSPTELTARIRVALRRSDEPESFRVGDLVIDYADRRVTVAGRDAGLTSTEYEVLRALSLRPGRLFTSTQLLDTVWGDMGVDGASRLRTIIKKLRRKLGDDAAKPTWIFSERGMGYRLAGPTGS